MKKLFVFQLLFLLVSCGGTIIHPNPEGVYTCRFEHEFAKVDDTLLLQKFNDNYYSIVRHSGVTSKSHHKKQMFTEVWKMEFVAGKNVFTEIKTGKTIIWEAGNLIFGNREYKKI